MDNDIMIGGDDGQYVVQRDGDELKIGRKADETVLWQSETVPVDTLPQHAREALDRGETDSEPLLRALEPVVDAMMQRGG